MEVYSNSTLYSSDDFSNTSMTCNYSGSGEPPDLDDILSCCYEQVRSLNQSELGNISSNPLIFACDWCDLMPSELDVLYSDQTCIKSRYSPLFLFCFLYSLIFFFGFTGNWLVLWAVITGGRALSSVMHLFIVNLALGDLLMIVLCVPATVVSTIVLHYWPFGYLLCISVSYLQVSCCF